MKIKSISDVRLERLKRRIKSCEMAKIVGLSKQEYSTIENNVEQVIERAKEFFNREEK